MSKEKLGYEPIFPIVTRQTGVNEYRIASENDKNKGEFLSSSFGISKRLYIATKCIPTANDMCSGLTIGYISDYIGINNGEYKSEIHYNRAVVKMAYEIADELLSQENK